MKKTILLLQLALIAGITQVAAQARRTDLQVKLVSPADDAEVKFDEPFEVEFHVKNLGPDLVLTGDTIAVQYSGMPAPSGLIIGQDMNVGDSVILGETITVSKVPSNPFTICATANVYSTINIDPDLSNNEHCNLVYFSNGSTGIGELAFSETIPVSALKAYPNPANDLVRFDYKVKEAGSVELMIKDMTGKITIHTDLGKKNAGDNDISADISSLVPGMYFIDIIESHAKGRGKLLIQR